MTRINVVPVSELADQHLLAEHREIKRIPSVISSWKYSLDKQPSEYTMWTGHVKFFYDKLSFLLERYTQLYQECKKRGFDVTNYIDSFKKDIPSSLFNYYIPTDEAIQINRNRIQEKLDEKKEKWIQYYRYYWKLI